MFPSRWINVPSMACPALLALLAAIRSLLWSRAQLQAEVLGLRHQLLVLKRQCAGRRVHFQTSDRGGSLRRECLDRVIALNERQLYQIVSNYAHYYNRARTHLALAKDAPEARRVQSRATGRVVAFPEVGGLHHRYERVAALND